MSQHLKNKKESWTVRCESRRVGTKRIREEPYGGGSLKAAHFKTLRHTAQLGRHTANTVHKTTGIGHAGSYKPSNEALLLF